MPQKRTQSRCIFARVHASHRDRAGTVSCCRKLQQKAHLPSADAQPHRAGSQVRTRSGNAQEIDMRREVEPVAAPLPLCQPWKCFCSPHHTPFPPQGGFGCSLRSAFFWPRPLCGRDCQLLVGQKRWRQAGLLRSLCACSQPMVKHPAHGRGGKEADVLLLKDAEHGAMRGRMQMSYTRTMSILPGIEKTPFLNVDCADSRAPSLWQEPLSKGRPAWPLPCIREPACCSKRQAAPGVCIESQQSSQQSIPTQSRQ